MFVNNACNDLAYNESSTVKTTKTNKEYCLPPNTNKYSPYDTMACYCIRLFCLTYNERKKDIFRNIVKKQALGIDSHI